MNLAPARPPTPSTTTTIDTTARRWFIQNSTYKRTKMTRRHVTGDIAALQPLQLRVLPAMQIHGGSRFVRSETPGAKRCKQNPFDATLVSHAGSGTIESTSPGAAGGHGIIAPAA